MTFHKHKDEVLECHACDSTELHYEITLCTECREKATCCDCVSDIQRELTVCSDDCAQLALQRIKRCSDALFGERMRRDRIEERQATARFEALDAQLTASIEEQAKARLESWRRATESRDRRCGVRQRFLRRGR